MSNNIREALAAECKRLAHLLADLSWKRADDACYKDVPADADEQARLAIKGAAAEVEAAIDALADTEQAPERTVTATLSGERQPLETIRYWINAYSDPESGSHFRGHGKLVQIAREYLEMREAADAAAAHAAPDREELLGDAIRALIRGEIQCSNDLPAEARPVHVSARRAFGAVHELLRARSK